MVESELINIEKCAHEYIKIPGSTLSFRVLKDKLMICNKGVYFGFNKQNIEDFKEIIKILEGEK